MNIYRVKWRVTLVEQEVFPLPEHLDSPTAFNGVRTARSYVFCVVFCRSVFVLFYFGTAPTVWHYLFFIFLWDLRTVPTVWHYLLFYWTLELFRQCVIICFSIGLWNCSDIVALFVFLLDFGTVSTVWHYLFFYWTLELFRQCGIIGFSFYYWTLELFRQCGIIGFSFYYWTLELFRQCGIIVFIGLWNCSDSVTLLVFLWDFGTVRQCGNILFSLFDFGTVPTV